MLCRRSFLATVCIISAMLIVGCSSEQDPANLPPMTEEPRTNNEETDSSPEVKQLPTASAIVEVEAAPAAVQTSNPTTVIEPTTEQSAAKANADVLFVLAKQESENTWNFTVTVEHPDTGWEDYADGWDVVLPDGSVVRPDPDSPFTRLLLHPHETEQPFKRSQGGIIIAPGTNQVLVRAHDIVDGFGGKEISLDLALENGQDYEVQRLPN